eukprot:756203-Hanusia_phi.AAC.3
MSPTTNHRTQELDQLRELLLLLAGMKQLNRSGERPVRALLGSSWDHARPLVHLLLPEVRCRHRPPVVHEDGRGNGGEDEEPEVAQRRAPVELQQVRQNYGHEHVGGEGCNGPVRLHPGHISSLGSRHVHGTRKDLRGHEGDGEERKGAGVATQRVLPWRELTEPRHAEEHSKHGQEDADDHERARGEVALHRL